MLVAGGDGPVRARVVQLVTRATQNNNSHGLTREMIRSAHVLYGPFYLGWAHEKFFVPRRFTHRPLPRTKQTYQPVLNSIELRPPMFRRPIVHTMKRHLLPVCTLILLCWSGLSGCSQTPYSYSDKDGFTMDYPSVGQDISGVVQDILNREGNPQTNKNATNGVVTFRVWGAKVIKADDVVPSHDWFCSSVLFRGHVTMILPNGQTVECEDFEHLEGTWQHGRFAMLDLNEIYGGANWGTGTLGDLQPAFLASFQHFLDTGGPHDWAPISPTPARLKDSSVSCAAKTWSTSNTTLAVGSRPIVLRWRTLI